MLASSVVCFSLLSAERYPGHVITGLSELELKSKVFELLEWLENNNYRAYIPRGDRDYAVAVGIRMLTIRRVIIERDGIFELNPEEQQLLDYYANSIIHLCPLATETDRKSAATSNDNQSVRRRFNLELDLQ